MANTTRAIFLCLLLYCCGLVQAATQIGRDYQFSYSAPDSTRNEAADADGRVEGTYAYVDPEGVQREVTYYAGGDLGFEAQGEGIVNVPRLIEETRARVLARGGPYEPSPEELASWATADRSYSLSYHAGDSARSEVSRPDGYVTGSYSYIDEEGNTRVVEYEAGPGIGFRVKGDHIHPKIASDDVPSEYDVPVLQQIARTRQEPIEPSQIDRTFNADGSITYSYVAIDHSRTETVYENGDVRGVYSYIGDDGQVKTVEYGGTSATGFVVSGDNIPSSIGSLDLLSSTVENFRGGLAGAGGTLSVGVRPGGSRFDSVQSQTVTGAGGLRLVGRPGGSTVETSLTETVSRAGDRSGGVGIAVQPVGGGRRVQIDQTRRVTETGGSNGRLGVTFTPAGGITRVDSTQVSRQSLGANGGSLDVVLRPAVGSVSTAQTASTVTQTGLGQGVRRVGIGGLGGSRVESVRTTETEQGGSAFPILASTLDGADQGQQITRITEETRRIGGGGVGGLRIVGTPGQRVITRHEERRVTGGSPFQILLQQSGGRGAGASGTHTVRTQTRRVISGPGNLSVIGGGQGGSRRRTQQTVSVTGNQLNQGPSLGYISFSTPDGKQHNVDLTQPRN